MPVYLQKVPGMPNMLYCPDDAAYKDLPQIGEYKVTRQDTGTETMLKTWRGWMAIMAQYMANNGAEMPLWHKNGEPYGSRPFNPDDAHEAFTSLFLGLDENGKRYSWGMSKSPDKEVAPKSKRLYAMEKMQEFALNRGIVLPTKENSEYFKLKKEQER